MATGIIRRPVAESFTRLSIFNGIILAIAPIAIRLVLPSISVLLSSPTSLSVLDTRTTILAITTEAPIETDISIRGSIFRHTIIAMTLCSLTIIIVAAVTVSLSTEYGIGTTTLIITAITDQRERSPVKDSINIRAISARCPDLPSMRGICQPDLVGMRCTECPFRRATGFASRAARSRRSNVNVLNSKRDGPVGRMVELPAPGAIVRH